MKHHLIRFALLAPLATTLALLSPRSAEAIVYYGDWQDHSDLAEPFDQTGGMLIGYAGETVYYPGSITFVNAEWGLATMHQFVNGPDFEEIFVYTGQDLYGGYDQKVNADQVVYYPQSSSDLVAVHFETPITGVDFAPLCSIDDVYDGMEITLVGYGSSGPVGAPVGGTWGYRLAGENLANIGYPLIAIGDDRLVSYLSHPGDADILPLEAGLYLGDSGGTGYTKNIYGDWVLAGINSEVRGDIGNYGSLSVFVNLANPEYAAWVNTTTAPVPEPGTMLLFVTGALGLLPLRRRRRS